jgi:ribosomal protein S18 acetylase RimI-like enzyme
MAVRPATLEDLPAVHELLRVFNEEVPLPPYLDHDDGRLRALVEEYISQHVALVAEENGATTGFVLARMRRPRLGYVSDLYVTPAVRRSGVAAGLLLEAAQSLRRQGAEFVSLEVFSENEDARAVYERWGFRPARVWLEVGVGDLVERLSSQAPAASHGLVFVQTDDEMRVTKAVRAYVPRLGRSARTDVYPPANGWTAVDDELCNGDPSLLRRLAQELSYRTGGVVLTLGVEEEAVVRYVLFDRGSVADEYCSLPEYHGPLAPGDIVALSANPTVAHRLTGADPQRLRAVAKTASSPADLPPVEDLYAELAGVLGVPLP